MEKIAFAIVLGGCLLSLGISAGGGLIPDPILYVVVGGGLLCIIILTVAFSGVLIVRAMSGYRDNSKHPPAARGDAWGPYRDHQEGPGRQSMPTYHHPPQGAIPHHPGAVHHGVVYPVCHQGIDYTVDLTRIGDGYRRQHRKEIPTPERELIRWKK